MHVKVLVCCFSTSLNPLFLGSVGCDGMPVASKYVDTEVFVFGEGAGSGVCGVSLFLPDVYWHLFDVVPPSSVSICSGFVCEVALFVVSMMYCVVGVAVVVVEDLVYEVWLLVVVSDFVEVFCRGFEVIGGVVVSFAWEYLTHVV